MKSIGVRRERLMPEPAELVRPEAKLAASRWDAGRIAYAAQALSLIFYVLAIWVEIRVDTCKAEALGTSLLRETHRRWRLRTSLLFLTWTILGGLALPSGLGLPVLLSAYVWFAARVAIGWRRWERGRAVGMRVPARGLGSAFADRASEHR